MLAKQQDTPPFPFFTQTQLSTISPCECNELPWDRMANARDGWLGRSLRRPRCSWLLNLGRRGLRPSHPLLVKCYHAGEPVSVRVKIAPS